MSRALIVVDVQNDFCRGGALAVPGGDEVVPVANELLSLFPISVLTQDWHPKGHVSFASTFGRPPFTALEDSLPPAVLWPDHCVAGSWGADFHPLLDTGRASLILRKGRKADLDSYSAFFENDGTTPTGLSGWCSAIGADGVVIAGLATDYCVKASALDARRLGLDAIIVSEGVRGVEAAPGDTEKAFREMELAGCHIIDIQEIRKWKR